MELLIAQYGAAKLANFPIEFHKVVFKRIKTGKYDA